VLYLENDINIQYSLKTSNYLISNILKYKILINIKEELRKMNKDDLLNRFNTNLQVFKTDTGINIQSDNDEEKELIEEITQKSIRSIKNRKLKKIESNIEIKSTRRSSKNIKKYVDLYIKFLKSTNDNQKTIDNYLPKFDLLIEYFNHKKIMSLTKITKKDCKDLQLYLLNYPKNLNKYQELKEKNIFQLIDKSDRILDKYETLNKRTVDNYITRYKTLFNYFLDNDYVYTNYFITIKNLVVKKENVFRDFISKEDTYSSFEIEEFEILQTKIKDRFQETKNFMILGLITGLRISEICLLKKINILQLQEKIYIDIEKSKTSNGIRIIPIHNKFNFFIHKLLKDKKENDYIFFTPMDGDRSKKIQKRISTQIRNYIKNENKVFHSFRKSFTQLLYQSDIEELYIKILLGHSLKDNLSFNTYNLSKINKNVLYEQIRKVNFESFFENMDFFPKENITKKVKVNLNEDNNTFV